MILPPPSVRGQIAPFLVMDVMESAARAEREGHTILHLEVGQPSTKAPRTVLEAAHAALENDLIGYTVAVGLPALRRRIAQHYLDFYGLEIDPEQVVITPGASGAFILAFLAAFDSGATVACTRPGYPCYRNILHALSLRPVEIETPIESGGQIGPEDLERLPERPAGLIVASPANPTGSVLDPASLRSLLEYCEQHGITVISDEIYHGLVYGGVAADTAARHGRQAIIVNSFSKYFSMTGWRLGWMIVPEPLRRNVETLAQNLLICPSTLSQLAGVAAFDAYPELDAHVERYARNRGRLLEALRDAGVERIAPADGAFYVYADVRRWTDDSQAFCRRMLEQIQVAATPGIDFDPVHGQHTVRFSYCTGEAQVERAAARIHAFLRERL